MGCSQSSSAELYKQMAVHIKQYFQTGKISKSFSQFVSNVTPDGTNAATFKFNYDGDIYDVKAEYHPLTNIVHWTAKQENCTGAACETSTTVNLST